MLDDLMELPKESLSDLARVHSWLDAEGISSGEITSSRPIGGGTQNIMIRFVQGGREYVLRRGPRHLRETTNSALTREIEVLRGLANSDVPHPRLIAACTDTSVLGDSVFYLMQPVEGVNAFVEISDLHRSDPIVRKQIGFELVDALLKLGQVDPESAGLDHLGRVEGFIERQVDRWLTELRKYNSIDGYTCKIPHLEAVTEWLRANLPARSQPGLMHGDFHLGNAMITPDGPQIAAIVDWEMCTVGEPLLDLGWLLSTWQQPDGEDVAESKLAAAGNLATPEELLSYYSSRTERDLSDITWYRVLACFKLGILLEGTFARSLVGKAPRELGVWMHDRTIRLFNQAGLLIV